MTTSMTPRWRLILNGKSAGDDDVRDAVTALRDAGVQLDVRVTWEAGDAERYVAEAIADGIDAIVAGGGDGTLSEVAAALARARSTARSAYIACAACPASCAFAGRRSAP